MRDFSFLRSILVSGTLLAISGPIAQPAAAVEPGATCIIDTLKDLSVDAYLEARGIKFSPGEFQSQMIVGWAKAGNPAVNSFLDSLKTFSAADQKDILTRLGELRTFKDPSNVFGTPMSEVDGITAVMESAKAQHVDIKSALTGLIEKSDAAITEIKRLDTRLGFDQINASALKITPDNTIEMTPLPSHDAGLDVLTPDENTMAQAEKAISILKRNPQLNHFSDSEKTLILRLNEAYKKTIDKAYVGDNSVLRTAQFKEPWDGGVTETIDQFIQTGRFTDGTWWVSSNEGNATITGETTRSFAKKLYGSPFKRDIFWPRAENGERGSADPDRFRIAVNKDLRGQPLSVEIMFKDEEGNWNSFIYVRRSNTWIPVQKINNKPIRETCLQCHHNASGELSPRPFS